MPPVAARTLLTNSGEKVSVYVPKSWRGDSTRRAIIACHAAGGDAGSVGGYDGKTLAEELGCALFYPDLSAGHTWGNDAANTAVTNAWTLAKASFGAKTDKAILFGGSMGGCTATLWAGRNPTLTAALGLVIPVLNTKDVRDNNRGGFAANVNAAFGGAAAFDAAEPTNNPYRFFSTITAAGIPIALYPNDLDSICLIQYARELRDAAGANCFYRETVGIDHFPNPDARLYDFLRRYVGAPSAAATMRDSTGALNTVRYEDALAPLAYEGGFLRDGNGATVIR